MFNYTDMNNIAMQLVGGGGFGGLETHLLGTGQQAV